MSGYKTKAEISFNSFCNDKGTVQFTKGMEKVSKVVTTTKNNLQTLKNPLLTAKKALIGQGMSAGLASKSMQRLKKQLPNVGWKLNNFNQVVDQSSGRMVNLGSITNKMSKYTMKHFAAEWLSILFIGQGISMMFKRMTDPVLKLAGVFDVWRVTLISLMGPVLFPLSAKLRNMMGYLRSLDPDVKKSVGVFTLFGQAASSLLSPLAQIALLVSSLGFDVAIRKKLFKWFGLISKTFSKLLKKAGILPAAFKKALGIVFLLWEGMKAIKLIISEWDTNLAAVGRGVATLAIVVGSIAAILLGAPVAFTAGLALAFIWILKISSKVEFINRILTSLGESFKRLFTAEGEMVKGGSKKGLLGRGLAHKLMGVIPAGNMMAQMILPTSSAPESVVPLSGGGGGAGVGMNYNPTINLSGGGSSAMDMDRVVREVNSRLYDDTRRM